MKNFNFIRSQQGIGILEVMIAVAILSIALLSLGGLHTMIIKSSGLAKERAVAVALAQKKLDDLRSFTQAETGGNGIFGYAEISGNGANTCTGGAEKTDGKLEFPCGSVPLANSNVQYDLRWTVTDYYYCNPSALPVTDTASCPATFPVPAYPHFKLATATVTWTDTDNAPQTISLAGSIYSMDPTTTAMSGGNPGGGEPPVVRYKTGSAPDVIPVKLDLSGDLKKEASKPEPDATAKEFSVITSFDEVTYNTTFTTFRRDSFVSVNCLCDQKGTTTSALPVRPVYDSAGDDLGFKAGDPTTETDDQVEAKKYGEISSSVPNTDTLNLCSRCCEQHHDKSVDPNTVTGSTDLKERDGVFKFLYDPFRSPTDYINYSSSYDHKHYVVTDFEDDTTDPDFGEFTWKDGNNNGEEYAESCRYIRVDGFLRMMQDWWMEGMVILPATYLTNTGGLAYYQGYVDDFVEKYLEVLFDNEAKYPTDTPTAVDPSAFSDLITDLNSDVATRSASAKEYTDIKKNTSETYIARAIYVDYMDYELRHRIYCLRQSTSGTTGCDGIDPGPYLHLVPFHEVNVTRFASWKALVETGVGTGVYTSDASKVTVTDGFLAQGAETSYSRGVVTTTATATPGTKIKLTAQIKRSNSGWTNANEISQIKKQGSATVQVFCTDNASTVTSNTTCFPIDPSESSNLDESSAASPKKKVTTIQLNIIN